MKVIKMKSTLPHSLFLTGVAIGALTFLAPNLTWADGKGASTLMFRAQPQTQVQSAPAKAEMSCPSCADVYTKVADTSAKGMRSGSLKTVAAHMCPACSTKITAVGAGKAKTDKVVHSCGMETSCCVATK
jgi:hypothetical protein